VTALVVAQATDSTGILTLLLIAALIGFGTLLYFVPFFVAWFRGARGIGGVLVLNVFLGWTFLGWIVALAWAAGGTKETK